MVLPPNDVNGTTLYVDRTWIVNGFKFVWDKSVGNLLRMALLSQEGSEIATRSREGWFQIRQSAAWSPLEPPRRFAPPLLTQEGIRLSIFKLRTAPFMVGFETGTRYRIRRNDT